MAWGRRCDLGCESWPDDKHYTTCPSCGEKTTRFSNLHPLSKTEASRAVFESFYEQWDDTHEPTRLAPDAPNAAGRYARVANLPALPQSTTA